ncbi:hypothetical protein BaRGS_00002923, partial [Batillaria attramentaria]
MRGLLMLAGDPVVCLSTAVEARVAKETLRGLGEFHRSASLPTHGQTMRSS